MINQTPVEWLEQQLNLTYAINKTNYFVIQDLIIQAKIMEKEKIIEELKIIGNAFNVETLDSREHRHHIRFTSIIKDRIDYYFNILLKLKNK